MAEADGGAARVTLFATGSEVAIAMAARDALQAEGVPTTVVSIPSWELFARQPAAYQSAVLAKHHVRVAVEAGSPFGWERFVCVAGTLVGLRTFGEPGPAADHYTGN